jgi:hypothetical protein
MMVEKTRLATRRSPADPFFIKLAAVAGRTIAVVSGFLKPTLVL